MCVCVPVFVTLADVPNMACIWGCHPDRIPYHLSLLQSGGIPLLWGYRPLQRLLHGHSVSLWKPVRFSRFRLEGQKGVES